MSYVVYTNRDPLHCLDLLSKNMAVTAVVKEVLNDSSEICAFLKRDRIDSIRQEAVQEGSVQEVVSPKKMVENRMVTVHLHMDSVRSQEEFMNSLKENPKFLSYYESRTPKQRKEIDMLLRKSNFFIFRSMDVLLNFSEHFVFAHKICSGKATPLAAYPLVVQALRNGLNKAISEDDCMFDKVLGAGSAKEVADMLRGRFNMDGKPPPGQKVGLLDEHHIWCYLVHPHAGEFRARFAIGGNVRTIAKNMISFYIPKDEDGKETARDAMLEEFEVSESLFSLFFLKTQPSNSFV